MLHIPALWYFGTSVTYPPWFRRVKLVVIPTFYIAAIFVKYCYTTGSWSQILEHRFSGMYNLWVGCYNSWANLRGSGCYPPEENYCETGLLGLWCRRRVLQTGMIFYPCLRCVLLAPESLMLMCITCILSCALLLPIAFKLITYGTARVKTSEHVNLCISLYTKNFLYHNLYPYWRNISRIVSKSACQRVV